MANLEKMCQEAEEIEKGLIELIKCLDKREQKEIIKYIVAKYYFVKPAGEKE